MEISIKGSRGRMSGMVGNKSKIIWEVSLNEALSGLGGICKPVRDFLKCVS